MSEMLRDHMNRSREAEFSEISPSATAVVFATAGEDLVAESLVAAPCITEEKEVVRKDMSVSKGEVAVDADSAATSLLLDKQDATLISDVESREPIRSSGSAEEDGGKTTGNSLESTKIVARKCPEVASVGAHKDDPESTETTSKSIENANSSDETVLSCKISSTSLNNNNRDSDDKSHSSTAKVEQQKREGASLGKPLVSPTKIAAKDASQHKAKKSVMIVDEKTPETVIAGKTAPGLKTCPSVGMNLQRFDGPINNNSPLGKASWEMMEEAWDQLKKSYVYYKGKPVGSLAATDTNAEVLNYNQVFVRDFVPSGLACLMHEPPEPEIVRNFLLKTLYLQGWEKRIDNFTLGKGVMPASFKVLHDSHEQKESLIADFGGSAIGRVAPVDSGFWWIILLRSYTKCTCDHSLSELPEVQRGMKLILNLCLSDGFDTFPTLLCADGCSMIDRRMGIYGYPIEIQALFYFALRCAKQMLKTERDGKELIERIDKRISALSYHIQNYYWLDFEQLNMIYRYKTEEYSHTAVNKFNVNPESIPDWVFDFMPLKGGYLIGNVSPARMDFRWFLLGNCIAILSSLVTREQATAIMDLIEERWEDLIGEMPLKIVYPALEGHEWRTVTGCDPKNTRWSYHNGGSWPVLLWLLTAACIKTGRPQMAKRAIERVEQRLSKDTWPEYYDGKTGRYVGKQARKFQTWSISGYLVAKMMIENPSNLVMISLEEDKKIAKPKLARSASF